MNIAHVRNGECCSEEDLVWLNDNWGKYNTEKMPKAVSQTAARTRPESIMHISTPAVKKKAMLQTWSQKNFLQVPKIASKNILRSTVK